MKGLAKFAIETCQMRTVILHQSFICEGVVSFPGNDEMIDNLGLQ